MIPEARVIAWYSDGAASAVAAKLACDKYAGLVDLVRCDTGSEHPSNVNFRDKVVPWTESVFGLTTLKNPKYRNVDEVIRHKSYLRGAQGAPCTVELKKIPRYGFQKAGDVHIFGYTYDKKDQKRAENFKHNNFELLLEFPLIEHKLTKQDCWGILKDAGIEIPIMYRLGFDNNNCIGCVKAESPRYWNLIRDNFPEVFAQRAKQERMLGFALCRYKKRSIYLDELDPGLRPAAKTAINCDFLCGTGEAT